MAESLFIDSSGAVVPVPEGQVTGAVQLGWLPASPKQVADYQLQQKYGGGKQQAIAALEGAGRGLTLGLSTVLERGAGVPAEDIAGREAANPATAAISEGVGVAAPLVSTLGGAAPFTGPALAAKAGASVTRALMPEAATVAGRILGSGAAAAAGSAVEGAFYGAGRVVHEAALGDPNLTAQSALGTIGLSAALLGGIGGLHGAAAESIPFVVENARDALTSALGGVEKFVAARAPATGTSSDVARLMLEHKLELTSLETQIPGLTKAVSAATPETAAWMVQNGQRLAEAERSFPGFTKTLSQAQPDTAQFILDNWQAVRKDPGSLNSLKTRQTDALRNVYESVESALKTANKEIRPAETEKYLAGPHLSVAGDALEWVDRDTALNSVGRIAATVDKTVSVMRAEPEMYAPGYARQIEAIRDGLKRDITIESSNAELFDRLKTLRKQLDELIPYGKDSLGLGLSDRNSIKQVKSLRAAVKEALHEEETWGSAAVRQDAFDDAQNSYLAARREFQKRFMLKGQDRSGRASYEVDPVKVNQWFNAMGDPRGAIRTRALDEYMQASRELLDQIETSRTAAPVADFDRRAAQSVMDKTSDLAADVRRGQTATELFKHLQGVQILGSGPVTPTVGGMAGQALGLLLPHAVTSTVKATADLAAGGVPKAVTILAAFERMNQKMQRRIESAASALVRSGPKAAEVSRAEAATGIAHAVLGTPEEIRAHYMQRVEDIQRLAQDPEQLHKALIAATDGWYEHAPRTADALNTTSTRAIAYLAQQIPQTPQAGPMAPALEPSRAQMADFLTLAHLIDHPQFALEMARARNLLPKHVQALAQVHPELLNHMRGTLMDAITSNRNPVTYQARLALSTLMAEDMDGTLSQPSLAHAAASFMPITAPQMHGGGNAKGKITLGRRTLPAMDRIAIGEEKQ